MATAKKATKKAAKKAAKGTAKAAGPPEIMQVRIELLDIKPPIWRSVQVPATITLAEMHDVIQLSMGWEYSHLYLFGSPETELEYSSHELDNVMPDNRELLARFLKTKRDKLYYVYDMGDDWQHLIKLEAMIAREPRAKYPRCVGGARACPPEDCGGPWGYLAGLEAHADPEHPDHDDYVEWYGRFRPEAFSLAAANKRLGELRGRSRAAGSAEDDTK